MTGCGDLRSLSTHISRRGDGTVPHLSLESAMPCRPSPRSLKRCSLEAVASNFELLCYGAPRGSKQLHSLIESDRITQFSSPFSEWPSSLLCELSDVVYAQRSGQKHFLYQIIQPQLQEYAIRLHGSVHIAMDLVSKRCKTLRKLELTYSVNIPPMYYVDFFRHFTHLTRLNVYASLVDDYAFEIIGLSCSNLQDLNAGKTWISNTGLERLSIGPNGEVRCPRLIVLNVLETKVTGEGIAVFLHTHPDAVRIEHSNTFHAFRYLWERPDVKYALENLSSCTADALSPDTLNTAVSTCKKVESVSLTNASAPGIVNQDLYRLMTLKTLSNLHLGNVDVYGPPGGGGPAFNFYEGVAPILETCGHGLKRLVLENMPEVDVSVIGEKCPRLACLALSNIFAYKLQAETKLNWDLFRCLDSLELWLIRDAPPVSADVVLQLLCPAKHLRRILLQNFVHRSFDDAFFLSVLRANPLIKLENAVIDQCDEITSALLWKLLEIPNQLKILRCWNCRLVTDSDQKSIKKSVREENLALYWEYYPYCEQPITHDLGEYEHEG